MFVCLFCNQGTRESAVMQCSDANSKQVVVAALVVASFGDSCSWVLLAI